MSEGLRFEEEPVQPSRALADTDNEIEHGDRARVASIALKHKKLRAEDPEERALNRELDSLDSKEDRAKTKYRIGEYPRSTQYLEAEIRQIYRATELTQQHAEELRADGSSLALKEAENLEELCEGLREHIAELRSIIADREQATKRFDQLEPKKYQSHKQIESALSRLDADPREKVRNDFNDTALSIGHIMADMNLDPRLAIDKRTHDLDRAEELEYAGLLADLELNGRAAVVLREAEKRRSPIPSLADRCLQALTYIKFNREDEARAILEEAKNKAERDLLHFFGNSRDGAVEPMVRDLYLYFHDLHCYAQLARALSDNATADTAYGLIGTHIMDSAFTRTNVHLDEATIQDLVDNGVFDNQSPPEIGSLLHDYGIHQAAQALLAYTMRGNADDAVVERGIEAIMGASNNYFLNRGANNRPHGTEIIWYIVKIYLCHGESVRFVQKYLEDIPLPYWDDQVYAALIQAELARAIWKEEKLQQKLKQTSKLPLPSGPVTPAIDALPVPGEDPLAEARAELEEYLKEQ